MTQQAAETQGQAQIETDAARRRQAEHLAEEARELWHKVAAESRKPSVGALIAGVAVLAAGAVWGATEAAVAAVAAYAVFRMLRKRAREAGERKPAQSQQAQGA
jgi:hypothetical protein